MIQNYTTTIAVEKTVAEVSRALAKAGAASVSTHYDADGNATGLGFSLRTDHGVREFNLPVNVPGVAAAIAQAHRNGQRASMAKSTLLSIGHAERVAWRIAKDWLESQLALIEANMASLDQVMLPYLVTDADGGTLYDRYRASEQRALDG